MPLAFDHEQGIDNFHQESRDAMMVPLDLRELWFSYARLLRVDYNTLFSFN